MKITYGRQEIKEEDIHAVVETLKSDFLTQGPKITEFEQIVAEKHNAKYAVAFSNGTTALHACYHVFGIKEGDEVISPAVTFAASSNGALYCGATSVLCDIDPETFCIDIDQIEGKITDKTKVLTPVSLGGYPVDLKRVREIADKYDLRVLYDAAHAIGSNRDGDFGLNYADLAILSFHPVKHIATGEGGMVLTNNKELYDALCSFRTHGITKNPDLFKNDPDGEWYYEMQELGQNYRMCDILAALGVSQVKRLEENVAARNKVATRYAEELADVEGIELPPRAGLDSLHSYHLYPIRFENLAVKKYVFEYMKKRNIFCQVHYVPLNFMPYYQEQFGYAKGDFPNAEEYYFRALSIPMFHSMNNEEQTYIIATLKEALASYE